ncbi:trypsin-like peptidase domain-containing protein [archaeon]|nr:trypsin-like peptidase domain-containing protein [archaeon]
MSLVKVLSLINSGITIVLLLVFVMNNFQIYDQDAKNSAMFSQLKGELDNAKVELQNAQTENYNLLLSELSNVDSKYKLQFILMNKKDQQNENKKIDKKLDELEFKASDFSDVIKNVMPSVVKITVKIPGKFKEIPMEEVKSEVNQALATKGYFLGDESSEDQITIVGSGAIVRSDGLVVTNKHVANAPSDICNDEFIKDFFTCSEDEATIEVQTSKDEVSEGKLTKTSSNYDLAFVKTDLRSKALSFASKIFQGDEVVALGNPLGIEFTATKGMISAVNSDINDGLGKFWLQTDTPINPGNSAGCLVIRKV